MMSEPKAVSMTGHPEYYIVPIEATFVDGVRVERETNPQEEKTAA